MRALAIAVAAAALTVNAPSAHAYRVGVGQMLGGGKANPGIPTTPTPNAIVVFGDATLFGAYGNLTEAGSDVGEPVTCNLVGNGTESTAFGVGGLIGWCGPVLFDTCAYVRVAVSWTVVCPNGTTAEWVFTPHQTNPTVTFSLAGTIHYTHVP